MTRWFTILLRRLLVLMLLTLAGGFLAATLVRYSPGFGVDERELDPRLSQSSTEWIRSQHNHQSNLIRYYGEYLRAAVHGDFGDSESLHRPVSQLLAERFRVTLRSVSLAVLVAWTAAFSLATLSWLFGGWLFDFSCTLLSGFLLSLPAAVIALLFVYLRAPVFLAIAVVLFPKLFRFIHNLLSHASEQPHVLAATARGVGKPQIFLRHILAPAAATLVALLGTSTSMGFGSAVPIEALTDSAGIGQLAWFAAINRDLPLIMNLTLVVTLITVACNSLADYSSKLIARQI
jgi:ABC-type dipeptide/oligopeptide/nickel transport system permease component